MINLLSAVLRKTLFQWKLKKFLKDFVKTFKGTNMKNFQKLHLAVDV